MMKRMGSDEVRIMEAVVGRDVKRRERQWE